MPSNQERMLAEASDRSLLETAMQFACEYLDSLPNRRAFPSASALGNLAAFDEILPIDPQPAHAVLDLLNTVGGPATATHGGGRYFGFVNGGVIPAAQAARWLADAWDQNAALFLTSPVASRLETVCEAWLIDLFDLPGTTGVGFVTGTASASLCGLAAGRNALLRKMGWDVNRDGLFGAPPLRVILGAQAHATVGKALGVLGLGKGRVEVVPSDDQGRMCIDALPRLDASCLIITQAGNVNSGAFDDFNRLCDRADAAGAWVHVDGAFGLWAQGSRTYSALTRGVNRASSWSADAHKTLNAPYDCGLVLCRQKQDLLDAMETSASYIVGTGARDGMHLTLDMSRRARSIELWATLKSLGRRGVEELVDGLCSHALRMAEGLRANGFKVLNDVVFNQVLVACDTQEETHGTLQRIQEQGACWCGSATWHETAVIRLSVCSWRTTAHDIDRSIDAFVQARSAFRESH